MAQVIFKQGNQINLPTTGKDSNTIYYVNDQANLYKSVGAGLPLTKITDVVVVDNLPTTNILTNKIYVLSKTDNIEIYIYENGDWKTIVSGGEVIDDDRIDILFNLKNKKDVLTYDNDNNVIKMETTGDVESVIDYEYDNEGNIIKETIDRQDHISINTFGYDNEGNIIEINTNVTKKQ